MKIITFNTLVGFVVPSAPSGWFALHQRIPKQIAYLQNINADVMCLQEVFSVQDAAAFEKGFPDYHCYKSARVPKSSGAFVYLLIIAILAFVPSVIVTKIISWALLPKVYATLLLMVLLVHVFIGVAVLRRSTIESVTTGYKAGLMTLVRKGMFVSIDAVYTDMPRHAQRGDSFNILNPRGMLTVNAMDANNKALRIINVHLNQEASNGRTAQLDAILAHVVPNTIVCGDFNATADSPDVQKLIASGLLPTQTTGATWNALTTEQYLLDYIFITDTLKSTQSEIARHGKISDHFGVWAILTTNQS
jgi:endonuclease/exonuclease/phosphatase family metal-dependent hydrolase